MNFSYSQLGQDVRVSRSLTLWYFIVTSSGERVSQAVRRALLRTLSYGRLLYIFDLSVGCGLSYLTTSDTNYRNYPRPVSSPSSYLIYARLYSIQTMQYQSLVIMNGKLQEYHIFLENLKITPPTLPKYYTRMIEYYGSPNLQG